MIHTNIQLYDVFQSFIIGVLAIQLYYFNKKRSEFHSGIFISVPLSILSLAIISSVTFNFIPHTVLFFLIKYGLDIVLICGSVWLFFISRKLANLPSELDLRLKNMALEEEILRREKAEDKLQSLNSHLEKLISIRTSENEAVIDASPLAIMKLNEKREVTIWNPAAEKLFGWTRDEVIGKANPVIPPQKKTEHSELFKNTLAGNSLLPLETQRLKKDGSLVDVCVWNAPLRGVEAGKAAMAIFDDITDRLKVRKELADAKKLAEQKSYSKSLFLANTGHEIRTPLNAILGYSDIILSEKLDEISLKEYVKTISNNARALQSLIDDLLDISKIEAGELSIRPQAASLSETFKEICATLQPKAEEKKLELSCSGLDNLPPVVCIDTQRLRQIVLNIVNNAIKFTPSGFVHINPIVAEGILTIEIKDSGIGMTLDETERLFKPFAQANTRVVQKFGGTGLGLFISKSLAQKMGGDVYVKSSSKDKGSTFIVRLQITELEDTATESKKIASVSLLNSMKILVVDDISENIFLATRFLRSAGAIVESTQSGFDVLAIVDRFQPDIILLDIQMPGKDGYEVVHELRNSGFKRPVVAMTAHSMREDVDKCLNEGFDSHISKPITKAALLNQVAACI